LAIGQYSICEFSERSVVGRKQYFNDREESLLIQLCTDVFVRKRDATATFDLHHALRRTSLPRSSTPQRGIFIYQTVSEDFP